MQPRQIDRDALHRMREEAVSFVLVPFDLCITLLSSDHLSGIIESHTGNEHISRETSIPLHRDLSFDIILIVLQGRCYSYLQYLSMNEHDSSSH